MSPADISTREASEDSKALGALLGDISDRLEAATARLLEGTQRLLLELSPRLVSARSLEHQLDRHLARRFNVFDYLRDDELGLSRVIADLLDPRASHGQGSLFLRRFLDGTPWPVNALDLDRCRISVSVEQVIADQRRIDILARFVTADGQAHGLAIENKPYAGDQKDQVRDYLRHLDKTYNGRFLLIYLSPNGEGPSEWSIPNRELAGWGDRFAVMAYDVPDQNKLRTKSLATWFRNCRNACDVERLRSFLRDAERFCERRFGGQEMTTTSEKQIVQEYLTSNPGQLHAAQAVYASWPDFRDQVCQRTLEDVHARVEQRLREEMSDCSDLRVFSQYKGETRWANVIWIYRESWAEYEMPDTPRTKTRTAVCLEADGKGALGWCIGVRSPLAVDKMATEQERQRRDNIAQRLARCDLNLARTSPHWPRWDLVRTEFADWYALVPELVEEQEQEDGEIASYFVESLVGIAVQAIPVIDEEDGSVTSG